jgi:hypothetical protein
MAGSRALVIVAPQPPPARLLARRAPAVAAAAAARVAAARAHAGAAQLAEHVDGAEDFLRGAAAAAGLGDHLAADLELRGGWGGRDGSDNVPQQPSVASLMTLSSTTDPHTTKTEA